MLTTLLFVAIIVSCKTFTKGFTKLNRFVHTRLVPFSKTTLASSGVYDDEDENDKHKKKYKYNYDYHSDSDSDFNLNNYIQEEENFTLPNNEEVDDSQKLYTLIWFDCEDCIKLLRDVKNNREKILYINGGHYFFDENDETNNPLFYKDDKLIATDIFSIYEELFFNKIIEE